VKPHSLKMELNRLAHVVLYFLHGLTDRDAALWPDDETVDEYPVGG